MPVLYGDFELRPVAEIDLSSTDQLTSDGRRIGKIVTAVLTGTIVTGMPDGVMTPLAVENQLTNILARQKEIREAFDPQGLLFQIQGWDGGTPFRMPAWTTAVAFQPGDWTQKCDYQITVTGPSIAGEDDDLSYIESASENWSFAEDETTWMTTVTHTVQAKGQTKFDGVGGVDVAAWKNARAFVVDKLALGWTAIGDAAWSPQSGQTLATQSNAFQSSGTAWNRIIQDEVDELDGTYSATETFILSSQGWYEERSESFSLSDAEPNYMATVSVSGTIHGLFTTQGDYAAKYTNAKVGWEAVKTLLHDRASALATGFTLSPHPVQVGPVQHDPKAGVITYSYVYNDRKLVDDAWEVHQISQSGSAEDYKNTVTVTGTVAGVLYMDVDDDPTVRLVRAYTRWTSIKTLTYAWAVAASGIAQLKPFPIRAELSEDAGNGSLSYTLIYDDREDERVEETRTFTKHYSRDDGQSAVSIQGQIKGLRTSSPASPLAHDDRYERYANAKSYWLETEPGLLGVAASLLGTLDVNPDVRSQVAAHNDKEGTIEYTYEYTSQQPPFCAGALSEHITIVDEDALPINAEHGVPGLARGPIFQSIGTRTAKSRTVTIEAVYPPGAPTVITPPTVNIDYYKPVYTDGIVSQPLQTQWEPTHSRLSVSKGWKYN